MQYAATVESLRTAAQQESAHTIDEIGTQVDQETARTDGRASARRRTARSSRCWSGTRQTSNKRRATQAEVARADAEFARRFAEVAQKFLEDAYEEGKPPVNSGGSRDTTTSRRTACRSRTRRRPALLRAVHGAPSRRSRAASGEDQRRDTPRRRRLRDSSCASTSDLLALKYFYPAPGPELRIDTTDSGFVHWRALHRAGGRPPGTDAALCRLPRTELKRRMLEQIVRYRPAHPRDLADDDRAADLPRDADRRRPSSRRSPRPARSARGPRPRATGCGRSRATTGR